VPSWLNQTGTDFAPSAELDTSSWFDSSLPPAAEQPEAVNVRASDDDSESMEAHEGMDDGAPIPRVPPVPPLSKAIEEAQATPDPNPPPTS
jgi:hypothetical protein